MRRFPSSRAHIAACTILLSATLICGAAAPAAAAAGEARLLRFPDISSSELVFTYAGDLWVAPRAGGESRRITSHPGDEFFAKFSPDGRWIAFSGEYDGNVDVFVVSADGGEPRRLTFHPAADLVLDWTPDGKQVLFRSTRSSESERFTKLFVVSVEGGLPAALPVPMGSLTSFSPDGRRIAYNPFSAEGRTWKRYRGGSTTAIAIYDLDQNTYEEIPRPNSNDMFPMWSGNAIYFQSDRDGVMNLYRYDLSDHSIRQLTRAQEFDVKWPSLGDGTIVYEQGGWLYTLDLTTEQSQKLDVRLASDKVQARPELRNVAARITSTELSPSAKRVLVGARGEVFTVPAEHGSPRNLTASPGVHELNATWAPDGEQVAYLSDRSGEYELYVRPQKGGEETRITQDGGVYRYGPIWSPDSKKLLYWDKSLRLWYVDLQSRKPVQIDHDDYTQFNGGAWSPDSRWVAYAKTQPSQQTSALWIYSLEDRKPTRVTSGFYNDRSPVFSPDGKLLWFISSRFYHPSGDRFDWHFSYFHTDGIFCVTLQADGKNPFAPRSDEEGQADDEKKDDGDKQEGGDKQDERGKGKKGDADAAKQEAAKVEPVKIEFDGIEARTALAELPPATYSALQARKEKLFFLTTPFEAQQAGGDDSAEPSNVLHMFDLKERKDKEILTGIDRYALDKDGGKVMYVAGSKVGIVDAAEGQSVGKGTVDVSGLQAWVDPQAEWRQILHEAWRIERDFFWDPAMYGMDWKKVGERYEAMLPWIAHRSDLNYIIGELIGELGTSHSYVGGGDVPARKKVSVGLLGVDFEADQGYYRFRKIFRTQAFSPKVRAPLAGPGLKVAEGDFLIAVNGQPLRVPQSPYAAFQGLAEQVVTLTVNNKPAAAGAWELSVTPVASEAGLRYLDWVEHNRRLVDAATGGKVGYMHVPNTAIGGLMMFDQYFSGQLDKQGLIVDERYNSGGFVPDFYTEKLGRQLLSWLAPRDGADQPWPPVAIYGPKVMIANEHAGSGGDCFPWFFQRLKIGPVVGTRTWGGLVGIARNIPMMDGGTVTAPEFAFFSTDHGGEWIVENKGVEPDFEVPQRADLVVAGHDPQLEKALELVKQALAQQPAPAKRPPYPHRP